MAGPEDYIGECFHCGATTHWIFDPAPDLCAMCAVRGRWSSMWGPEQLDDYRTMLRCLFRGDPPTRPLP